MLREAGQQAAVERLGEALEQPGVGAQVDARHERVGELANRHVDLAEQRLRAGLSEDRADRLPTRQSGQIEGREAGLELHQPARVERRPGARAAFAGRRLQRLQELVEVDAKSVVLALQLEPAAELADLRRLAARLEQDILTVVGRAVGGVGERIVAEQVAQAQDDRIDLRERAGLP